MAVCFNSSKLLEPTPEMIDELEHGAWQIYYCGMHLLASSIMYIKVMQSRTKAMLCTINELMMVWCHSIHLPVPVPVLSPCDVRPKGHLGCTKVAAPHIKERQDCSMLEARLFYKSIMSSFSLHGNGNAFVFGSA
ncbi:hypothetical protein FRACYDRAFT_254540 [Fragilariopsis cylindrus CCMP1102]|uniref:Uncharacterized protein n=1 Tax=Fragilariopsis cylindrus CCMP1102 TaxID=635003 RepID=A0A1E7EKS0_9STRA|nr:hypothetical protein FRACYDRAFT_254540 [Fragilariopsis cylindrus CCMP1102]|eukprot:OEU06520.1 hypothetical protein FRACYDRAFT_254540 [Fragilariopsis cylindrus CCMP1102]